MGAADVVPGVSGGTIAFITGIYEELLETISKLNISTFSIVRKQGLKAFWAAINGRFLAVLFLGILTSIATLASLIQFLLKEHTILVWSFFFGLIAASVWLVGKRVKLWSVYKVLALILGTVIAYFVTIATPSGGSESLWYIFFCGMLAITAMILPGISGAFILLLLGAYATVLSAISDLNILTLGVFAGGCLLGLISFSKLLNWLFKKAHDITVALLAGFLIGSLNKVWPWKNTLEHFVKHKGEPNEELVPLVQENILPQTFSEITQTENQLIFAIILGLLGATIIVVMHKFSPEK